MPNLQQFIDNHPELENEDEDTQQQYYEDWVEDFNFSFTDN